MRLMVVFLGAVCVVISHQILKYGNRYDNLVHPFSATNWKVKSLERCKYVAAYLFSKY